MMLTFIAKVRRSNGGSSRYSLATGVADWSTFGYLTWTTFYHLGGFSEKAKFGEAKKAIFPKIEI